MKSKSNGKIYVVAESRLSELPVEKAKKAIPKGAVDDKSKSSVVAYEVLDKFPGSSLVGKK